MTSRHEVVVRKLWKDWIKPVGMVLVVLGAFRSAVADWNDVPTGSMKPTILEGDRIAVNKAAYGVRVPFTTRWIARWDQPERGEIVVMMSPADGTRLVKRVIAVPGDTIEMQNNVVVINGRALKYDRPDAEDAEALGPEGTRGRHLATEKLGMAAHAVMATPDSPALRTFSLVVVPAGKYFVLGDNRDESADSRAFGFVSEHLIVGRSPAVVFSLDRDNYYRPRLGRLFKALR